jgi:hypothetical protein
MCNYSLSVVNCHFKKDAYLEELFYTCLFCIFFSPGRYDWILCMRSGAQSRNEATCQEPSPTTGSETGAAQPSPPLWYFDVHKGRIETTSMQSGRTDVGHSPHRDGQPERETSSISALRMVKVTQYLKWIRKYSSL